MHRKVDLACMVKLYVVAVDIEYLLGMVLQELVGFWLIYIAV